MPTTKAKQPAGARTSKWKDEFVWLAYEHAKAGFGDKKIANALGVELNSLKGYLRKYPILAAAIERGRTVRNRRESFNFMGYIYKQMSPRLQKLWDEMERLRTEPNGLLRMEALLEDAGTRARQHLFVNALVACNFNKSEACKKVNLPYITLWQWMKHDVFFEQLMDEIDEHRKNFLEGTLMDLVAQKEVSAVLFACKTQLGDRGYNPTKTVNVQGKVDHNHKMSIDDLNLPLETRIAIRDAMKLKQTPLIEATTNKPSSNAEGE